MVTGIFAGNPWKMSLKACFPRIWEMEQTYGSLTKALFAIKRKRKSAGPAGPSGILTSFHEGTQYLIDSLAGRKDINLLLNRPAKKISYSNNGWKVNGKSYDIVISALPSYVFAELIEGFAGNAAKKLREIPYSPMSVVGIGFKKDITSGKNDGFGFLIPNREKRKILGCLFSSNIFPGRAPKGYDLLQVMLGGARFTEIIDMTDDEIKKLAIDEIRSILRLNGDPDFVKIFSWENAIPQYMRGHLDLIDEIKEDLKDFDSLFFTGNAYYGIGINDCTKAAYETAETVASYLKKD